MLNIIFNETQKLLEEVANFSLDFAISDDTFSPQFAAKILRRPIFKEELVLVCSKNYFKVHENSFPELQKMKELTYTKHKVHHK